MKRIIFFIKKYFLPVLLFALYEAFWLTIGLIFISFFPNDLRFELSPWIPTDWIITEMLIVFTIYTPFIGFLSYVLGGYILAPIFLFIHKKVFGRNLIYGIQEKPTPTTIKFFGKGFFPIMFSLMLATNLYAKFLTDDISNFLFSTDFNNYLGGTPVEQQMYNIVGLLVTLPWTFGISMFLFASIWFLKNSGIIYSNEKKVKSISEPFIIRSVGGWFHTVIKGYAGIGVIVTYFTVIVDLIDIFVKTNELFYLAISLILWGLLLIMLLLATIPGLIFNEMIRHTSGDYVRRRGAKLGIVEFAEIKLTFKKMIVSEEGIVPEKEKILEPEYEVTKVLESSVDKFTTQDFESETPDHIDEITFKETEQKSESDNDKTGEE
ncbi:MAG: hypothetical protein KGD57_09575 [Candidatus Lokiarchaeota archaeon]|nr:hypothetical protein [Candidatus Lokiarchaeota archaeon]